MTPEAEIIVALEEFIKERDHVSMVEVSRFLEENGVPIKGDLAFVLSEPNIALWAGMSQEFSDVMHSINERGKVTIEPASLLVYLIDGAMLRMPLAKRPPKKGYKETHWAPVCLRHKATVANRGS